MKKSILLSLFVTVLVLFTWLLSSCGGTGASTPPPSSSAGEQAEAGEGEPLAPPELTPGQDETQDSEPDDRPQTSMDSFWTNLSGIWILSDERPISSFLSFEIWDGEPVQVSGWFYSEFYVAYVTDIAQTGDDTYVVTYFEPGSDADSMNGYSEPYTYQMELDVSGLSEGVIRLMNLNNGYESVWVYFAMSLDEAVTKL